MDLFIRPNIFIIAILKSLLCASVILHFPRPTVVGLLGSGGGRLSWLLTFVFLLQCLGSWSYNDGGVYRWSCLYWHSIPWFLLCSLDFRKA